MSKTKAVHVMDRSAWTWDSSHDIVLAHLVEAAVDAGHGEKPYMEYWRVWASIPRSGLQIPGAA